MTEALPESLLGPVTARSAITGLSSFDIITDGARDVKSLKPEPTVWGYGNGRPIYDRLPGVSEAYRIDYFGDAKTGLVYIDPQFGTLSGPGSLEVGRLPDDGSVLIIQSGTITWSYGQIPTTGLAIDLRSIVAGGAQDGVYQVGYYLDYSRPDDLSYSIYRVENRSLSNTLTAFAASSEAGDALVEYAFSELDDGSWKPNSDGDAGEYATGTSISMDFMQPVIAEEFELSGTTESTAWCALYSSVDAIVWDLADQTAFNGSWQLRAPSNRPARYWRFFFWGGSAEVTNVLYTGEALFPNNRPSGAVSSAEPFLEDDQFADIDRPHILLAQVEVKEQQVVTVTDLRRQTSTKYEPVAKWLTDFQDSSLRTLLSDVAEYSSRYMTPQTACESMYLELESETFILGTEVDRAEIIFPDYIELESGWTVSSNGIDYYRSNSSVTPSGVILLTDPTGADGLATKQYTDFELIPSLNNGKY